MARDPDKARMWLVLMAMTAANAMILVDQTAVPLALPDIMRTFGAGTQEVQSVLKGVTVLAAIGCACVAWLVRPPTPGGPDPPEAGG